ncbi:MAG TPA: hypothetical protein VGG26_00735 [Terracidiphilus sp.]
MTPILRSSALIALVVSLQGMHFSWGQASKNAAELTYASFQGQPAPSKKLLAELVREVRWDTRPADENPQGLRLRFEKVGDSASADALVRYRVFADGAPENKVYALGVWSVGKAVSYGAQEVYANSQGLLMIHRPTPEQDTRFKAPGDELELMPQAGAAEPVRYILASKDGQLSILGTVVPHPVVARDQACTLEVRIAEPDAAAVLIVAGGFPAGARIPVVLESEGATATLTMTTDGGGQAEVADFPGVLGKAQGTLKATAEASDCLPSALLPWGAGTMAQKAP